MSVNFTSVVRARPLMDRERDAGEVECCHAGPDASFVIDGAAGEEGTGEPGSPYTFKWSDGGWSLALVQRRPNR